MKCECLNHDSFLIWDGTDHSVMQSEVLLPELRSTYLHTTCTTFRPAWPPRHGKRTMITPRVPLPLIYRMLSVVRNVHDATPDMVKTVSEACSMDPAIQSFRVVSRGCLFMNMAEGVVKVGCVEA